MRDSSSRSETMALHAVDLLQAAAQRLAQLLGLAARRACLSGITPRAAQRHFEVGLHDGERRAQLVRGVGDEALLGTVEFADGVQGAPRIPEPQRTDRHDDHAVGGHELPAQAADRPRGQLAFDLVPMLAGTTLCDAGDVRLDGEVHDHARHGHEQHDDGREQHHEARGRAGEDVGAAATGHHQLRHAAGSRRRARSPAGAVRRRRRPCGAGSSGARRSRCCRRRTRRPRRGRECGRG